MIIKIKIKIKIKINKNKMMCFFKKLYFRERLQYKRGGIMTKAPFGSAYFKQKSCLK